MYYYLLWKLTEWLYGLFDEKIWLTLVAQVTVMHSMQAGYMDKAQKYTDKALIQIEKLKSKFVCVFLVL